jgi:hypothetical protein
MEEWKEITDYPNYEISNLGTETVTLPFLVMLEFAKSPIVITF